MTNDSKNFNAVEHGIKQKKHQQLQSRSKLNTGNNFFTTRIKRAKTLHIGVKH